MTKKILILCVLIAGVMFLPTTILLTFGMLPTLVVLAIDRTIGKNRTLCVACMNFAGCFPFLLKFWTTFGEQTTENAFAVAGNAQSIMTIYLLAAGGYAIDLAVTGITASFIIQRAESRMKSIKKQQKEMAKQWGEKVTGRYKLDEHGFPNDNELEHRTKL